MTTQIAYDGGGTALGDVTPTTEVVAGVDGTVGDTPVNQNIDVTP